MSNTPFDTREFRNALGSFATGVTIITTRDEAGEAVGITANSFNSVSLDPPMVLWSLAKTSRSLVAFERSRHWAVHILSAGQESLSNRFARSGADKFAGLPELRGIASLPLLEGCATRLQCETSFVYEGGDHLIFVGRVLAFDRNDLPPLAFHSGRYAVITRKADAPPPDAPRKPGWSQDHLPYLLGRAYFQIYSRIRDRALALGLDEAAHFTLATLLMQPQGATLAQVNAVFSYAGCKATEATLEALAARSLLERRSGAPEQLRLSATGRELTLHLVAAAEAIETDVLGRYGEADGLALRNLLRHFVQQTDPGLPDLWNSASAA